MQRSLPLSPHLGSRRLNVWGRTPQLLCAVAFLAMTAFADSPANLVLRVQNQSAVRGGWVQLQVFATAPACVASGSIHMNLDPAIFGDVAGVGIFSAAGDAIGEVTVNSGAVDAIFQSPWAGIGQLPDLPILTVRAPVLANAPLGAASVSIVPSVHTFDPFAPSAATWTDTNGNPYSVTAASGSITIQASGVFVQDVQPGGGVLAPGTIVRVVGGGFDTSTTVAIDGVAISPANFVSTQEIDVSINAAIELTGHHVRVSSGGIEVGHYTSLPSLDQPVAAGAIAKHWIAPFAESQFLLLPGSTVAASAPGAILNPNSFPVQVQFASVDEFEGGLHPGPSAVMIESFGIAQIFAPLSDQYISIAASGPVRAAFLTTATGGGYQVTTLTAAEASTGSLPGPRISGPLPFQWQIGTPPPSPETISLAGLSQFPIAIAGAPPWLTIQQGTPRASNPTSVTFTPDPASANLPPGDYRLNLTASFVLPDSYSLFAIPTSTFTVELIVFAQPKLVATVSNTSFRYTVGGTPPPSIQIPLRSTDNSPLDFTVAAVSVGNWLSVSPSNGTTPAMLTLSANPAALAAITGTYQGTITIQGPSNTLTITPFLSVAPSTPQLLASPPSVSFVNEAGASAMNTSFISYTRLSDVTASVSTQSGGPWLTIEGMTQAGALPSVTIAASSQNLAAGVYRGTVTLTSTSAGTVQVPVTMTVIAAPTAQTQFTITPSSIDLTAPAGQPFPTQTIQISSNDGPHIVNAGSALGSLTVTASGPNVTTPLTLSYTPSIYLPNQSGTIVVTWTGGSFTIPVTLHMAAGPGLAPRLGAIVNAASLAASSIAPGEIITILGAAIGPAAQGLAIDSSGRVANSLGGTQVFVNQIPAPLIYVSPEQISAIVPYEIGSTGFANIRLAAGGQSSDTWTLPISATSPGIFTLSGTGIGRGAILNADYSVNSSSNRAARGSTIQIYATGEGQTNPAGVTGSIIGTDLKRPLAGVKVNIGGAEAQMTYAGSAGDSVAGLLQVNAIVPQNATSGDAVPVIVTIGGVPSQANITVAVQ